MKFLATRSLNSLLVALILLFGAPAAFAGHHNSSPTIVEILSDTDGAQAVVAAVLVVDEAGVLGELALAELLSDPSTAVILFAPSNSAFEDLFGLDRGSLTGLDIETIKGALPGILSGLGLDANAVASILLKHAALPKEANPESLSENALLSAGHVVVADKSNFTVGIGKFGVQINNETTIIKADVYARNGVIHYIDSVIVDDLL